MDIFVIESPLQLLNAIEAQSYFHSTLSILIVKLSGDKKNNHQIDLLLIKSKWFKVYKVKFYISSKVQIFQFSFLVKMLKIKYASSDKIFIGEFRSDYMWMLINNIKFRQIILLDDGNMTLEIQKKYISNIDFLNLQRNSKKDFFFNFFGLKSSRRKMIDLFTMFDIPALKNQSIYLNQFNQLNCQILNTVSSNSTLVYFVGGNLTELGIISEKYFFRALNFIRQYYLKLGKKMIYIPHRRENLNKLKKLGKFAIKVEHFSNPIELEFIYRNSKPSHIASFYSTALFTLQKIYNIDNVDAFRIKNEELNSSFLSEIETTYNFYFKYMNIIQIPA